jgi:hypothetical protein
MALYVDRSVKIQQHNAEAATGLHSYTMEENHLIDHVINKLSLNDLLSLNIYLFQTDEEIQAKLGAVAPATSTRSQFGVPLSDRAIPSSVCDPLVTTFARPLMNNLLD